MQPAKLAQLKARTATRKKAGLIPDYRHGKQRGPRPVTQPAAPAIEVRVKRRGCRSKCTWAWAVLVGGVLRESGEAETEAAARAAAEQEAIELAQLTGASYQP